MNTDIKHFVIRVYGIFFNQKKEILISDEFQKNMKMTKFPGGGMYFGEGPIDCLKREAVEEFGQEIIVAEHFYTTDYFQPAFFYDNYQLISIYYFAKFKEPVKFKISTKPYDFSELKNGNMSFRWMPLRKISEEDMTLPIDKRVLKMLKQKFL
ncbi:MAG TPA: NUDIX domain-containing protein [Bacteroidales bacterium]|nr:NUDIX domain-containing protein [Bacteroidales bacterium]